MGWVYPQYKELIDPSAHIVKNPSRVSLEPWRWLVFCVTSAYLSLEGNIPKHGLYPPQSQSPLKKRDLEVNTLQNDESSQFWYSCSTFSISCVLNKSQIWSRPKTLKKKPTACGETNSDDPSQSGCDPVILKGSEGKMGNKQICFFCGFA